MYFAYLYALYLDQKPTEETRTAACQNSEWAYKYARDVDKKPTYETKTNALKNQYWKKEYVLWEKSIC
jgi:hypothetical protein